MDRKSKRIIAACCLIFPLYAAWAGPIKPLKVGTITQSHNRVTFLDYVTTANVLEVKEQSDLMTEGSYLTSDEAFLTARLFDGSWLRASPQTKFAVEFDKKAKNLTVNLFTGSMKAMISQKLSKGEIQKILFKSADSMAEASEAKFSIVRTPVLDMFSVYVEKGVVTISKGKATVLVHALEMVSVHDKKPEIEEPHKMDEKQLKFLHGKSYLKSIQGKN